MAQTGKFTYDPGYKSTASCESALTYIDGERRRVLLHRGYPIGQLAEHSSFMEVAYLLLNGELPNQEELDDFTYTITRHTMLHDQLRQFYQGFRRDAHPMAIMCGVVGALSAFYHDSTDISDPEHRKISEPPPDREDADHRCDGRINMQSDSHSCSRTTRSATRATSCA